MIVDIPKKIEFFVDAHMLVDKYELQLKLTVGPSDAELLNWDLTENEWLAAMWLTMIRIDNEN